MERYDLVVIGAGPGGYEAALEAAGLGLRTALIERRQLGGTCLNRGCIPTKALAHAAGLYAELSACGRFGLSAEQLRCDPAALAAYRQSTVETLRGGIALRLKQKKVDLFQGSGLVTAPHRVRVEPPQGGALELEAQNILVAAGAKPAVPPIPGAQLPGVMTSDELLEWGGPPFGTLLVIGGGVIGVEFASIYAALGSRVVILEALDGLLANLDRELWQSLKLLFKKRGVQVHTGARVEALEPAGEKGRLCCRYTEKGVPAECGADAVLLAVGRTPCGLGAFAPGVAPASEKGRLLVNSAFATSLPGVYAIGDAIGGAQLAHLATAQGLAVVRALAGKAPGLRLDVVPACVYTEPEIASVGLSADEAKARGLAVQSKKYPMSANGRSVLTGQERGFIKVVYDPAGRAVLGAQLMCARATDRVGEFGLAIANGLTVEQMAAAIRPHPTFSEGHSEVLRSC